MNNISVLAVKESFNYLCDNVAGALFREALLPSELLVKIAMFAVLEYYIDILGVVKIPMQFNNIWMVKSPLNLKLSFHLGKEVELF